MEKKKAILIILDGAGDRALKELNYKTPLQYANTPNLDKIAKSSMTGLMDPIAPGIRAGSDTAHLNILGYNPYEVYTGRGPFEAAGVDMDIRPGDIAFRCNFSTVDDNLVVIDRRAGRIKEGTGKLAEAINGIEIDGIKFFVKEGVEHRAALVMRGENLSPYVSDVDPHDTNVRIRNSVALKNGAEKTARVLNKFVLKSYEILKNHAVNMEREKRGLKPANILLPRGAGIAPTLENFKKKYDLKAGCVVGVPLLRGICKLAGIKPIKCRGATGGYDTDMMGKMDTAVNSLKDYDFILMNIKATDLAGHDMEPFKKVEVIERIDDAMGHLVDILPKNVILVITADHSTPCSVGDHSGDPVPIMIYGDDVRQEGTEFNEISCARGSLRIRGEDTMNIIMNMTNRAEKYGA